MFEDDLLTVPEAAREYGYSAGRLHQVIKAGRLPAWRRGHNVWVTRAGMEAYLRSKRKYVYSRPRGATAAGAPRTAPAEPTEVAS